MPGDLCTFDRPTPLPPPGVAELSALSNFTFLTGGSHPEDYIARAALIGLSAVVIADTNSVAGVVRAYTEAKEIRRKEDDLFDNDEQVDILREIMTLKRNIITARSILLPQRSLIALLEQNIFFFLSQTIVT